MLDSSTVILHGWSRMFHFCMNKCPEIFVYKVQVLLEALFKHRKCVINKKIIIYGIHVSCDPFLLDAFTYVDSRL